MRIEKILVTPSIAELYLGKMIQNRNIKESNIIKLTESIKKGYWNAENGEFIKIDKNGKLIDGQHRLRAVIKANTSIYMSFIFDCDPSSYQSLDIGISRSFGDILKMKGYKNYNKIPNVIQNESVIIKGVTIRRLSGNSEINNIIDIERIYLENMEYIDYCITQGAKYYSRFKFLQNSVYHSYLNIFSKIDLDSAIEFFEQLTSLNVHDTNIELLKSILIKDAHTNIRKLNPVEKEALFIKSWNGYMQGKSPRFIRWQPSVEPYPTVFGIELIKNKFT